MATPIDPSELFAPYTTRGTELTDRFVMPGMQTGAPRRADSRDGGVLRSPCVGRCVADHQRRRCGRSSVGDLAEDAAQVTSATFDRWARYADAVHAAGGVFLPQLFREGAISKGD